ncbi:hypothetical protein HK405_007555, partial [Cladochytrium tenue]
MTAAAAAPGSTAPVGPQVSPTTPIGFGDDHPAICFTSQPASSSTGTSAALLSLAGHKRLAPGDEYLHVGGFHQLAQHDDPKHFRHDRQIPPAAMGSGSSGVHGAGDEDGLIAGHVVGPVQNPPAPLSESGSDTDVEGDATADNGAGPGNAGAVADSSSGSSHTPVTNKSAPGASATGSTSSSMPPARSLAAASPSPLQQLRRRVAGEALGGGLPKLSCFGEVARIADSQAGVNPTLLRVTRHLRVPAPSAAAAPAAADAPSPAVSTPPPPPATVVAVDLDARFEGRGRGGRDRFIPGDAVCLCTVDVGSPPAPCARAYKQLTSLLTHVLAAHPVAAGRALRIPPGRLPLAAASPASTAAAVAAAAAALNHPTTPQPAPLPTSPPPPPPTPPPPPPPSSQMDGSAAAAEEFDPDRPFRCWVTDCDRRYRNPGGLAYHVENAHIYAAADAQLPTTPSPASRPQPKSTFGRPPTIPVAAAAATAAAGTVVSAVAPATATASVLPASAADDKHSANGRVWAFNCPFAGCDRRYTTK